MKNSNHPLILNDKGLSLVTVLVAAAIMTTIGLAIASMLKSTADIQATIKARDEADNAKLIAAAYLRNPEICRKSLLNNTGIKLSQIEGDSGHRVKSIISPSGEKILEAGTKGSGPSEMIFEPINQDKKAAEISPTLYMAQLRIRHSKDDGSVGSAVADRILPVQVSLSGGNAINCQTIGGGSDLVDTLDPHENPRNCVGGIIDITDPKSPDFNKQAAGPLKKELMDKFKLPVVDNSGVPMPSSETYRYGRRRTASTSGTAYEGVYDGKKYRFLPTITEGSMTASSGDWGMDGSHSMSSTTTRKICINGKLVTLDSASHSRDLPGGDGGARGY